MIVPSIFSTTSIRLVKYYSKISKIVQKFYFTDCLKLHHLQPKMVVIFLRCPIRVLMCCEVDDDLLLALALLDLLLHEQLLRHDLPIPILLILLAVHP